MQRLSTLIVLIAFCLTACVTQPNRPAHSSYSCMRAVRDSLPADLNDKRAHCLAAALIAQHCSTLEAYIAGAGKEIGDLFTAGDAEWSDWRADRMGIACAAKNKQADALTQCCMEHGY